MAEPLANDEFDLVESLLLDLLEWLRPSRAFEDVMEAWRTSCPRLPVWEEANRRGFVRREREQGLPAYVVLTAAGEQHLTAHRADSGATASF